MRPRSNAGFNRPPRKQRSFAYESINATPTNQSTQKNTKKGKEKTSEKKEKKTTIVRALPTSPLPRLLLSHLLPYLENREGTMGRAEKEPRVERPAVIRTETSSSSLAAAAHEAAASVAVACALMVAPPPPLLAPLPAVAAWARRRPPHSTYTCEGFGSNRLRCRSAPGISYRTESGRPRIEEGQKGHHPFDPRGPSGRTSSASDSLLLLLR